MRKAACDLIGILVITAITACPALAQGDVPSATSKEPDKTSEAPHSMAGRVFAVPKMAAGVVCGVTVGVPARIAREVAYHTHTMNKQLTDDLSGGPQADAFARVMAAGMAVPFGVASGVITGSIYGVERGVDYGQRKPFSKESMSLRGPFDKPQ